MAAAGEDRTTQMMVGQLLLLLLLGSARAVQAGMPYGPLGPGMQVLPDMVLSDIIIEDAEYFEPVDDNEIDLSPYDNSDSDCDWSEEFGPNHSVNLTPLDKCEKFKLKEGPIFQRGISEDDKEAILKIHNKLRSKVAAGNEKQGNPGPQPSGSNINELVWNDQLAVAAQGWADQCAPKHDKQKNRKTCIHKRFSIGQNVAHTRGGGKKPTTVLWTKFVETIYKKEVVKMPESNVDKIKGISGHYTQLIWAKTRQVGCGVVYYRLEEEKANGKIKKHLARSFVCNYYPSGNVKGGQVYKRGNPASNCKHGVSTNYPNLCAPRSN